MKYVIYATLSVLLGAILQVSGQSLTRQNPGIATPRVNPSYNPTGEARGTKLFTYCLSASPNTLNQAAWEALTQPANYDGHLVVVGLVRLRGEGTQITEGSARLFRLGQNGQGQLVLLEQKSWLKLNPNLTLSPRPVPTLPFTVIPVGEEGTVTTSLLPQAAPMTVSITAATVGTQTLELGLLDGAGQILDGRRLALVQVIGPEGVESTSGLPSGGTTSLTVGAPPIGWRTNQPQYTNLVQPGTTVYGQPQPVPEPAADSRQPITGTHQPVQQFRTTSGEGLPPYTPPPTAGERGGLKSQPPFPSQVLAQPAGKDTERKNHRP